MLTSLRPYVTAALAIVSSTVITAASIAPTPGLQALDDSNVSTTEVDLAAAVQNTARENLGYIPQNLFNALANMPAAFLDGVNHFSYSLEVTENWWQYTPTNILGFDEADPPKVEAVIQLLVPFQPLAAVLEDHIGWWMKANVPIHDGCTGFPGPCPDAAAILASMFQVSVFDLINGYEFPELINPVDGEELSWSGEEVQLNPNDIPNALFNYFLGEPGEVEPVTFADITRAGQRFSAAYELGFNPFVSGSYIFDPKMSAFALFARPLGRVLCDCVDDEPPWEYDDGTTVFNPDGIVTPIDRAYWAFVDSVDQALKPGAERLREVMFPQVETLQTPSEDPGNPADHRAEGTAQLLAASLPDGGEPDDQNAQVRRQNTLFDATPAEIRSVEQPEVEPAGASADATPQRSTFETELRQETDTVLETVRQESAPSRGDANLLRPALRSNGSGDSRPTADTKTDRVQSERRPQRQQSNHRINRDRSSLTAPPTRSNATERTGPGTQRSDPRSNSESRAGNRGDSSNRNSQNRSEQTSSTPGSRSGPPSGSSGSSSSGSGSS